MVRAIWKDTVLAESDDTVVVEGNHYFPPEGLDPEPEAEHIRGHVAFWKGVTVQ